MDDLKALLDREAIVDLVNRLFVAVDNRDWAAAQACFADRVRFDMTSAGDLTVKELTPREITDAWEVALAPVEAIHHQSGNFRVQILGDDGTCLCYGTAFHFRRVHSGRNTRTFVGSYEYRLSRASGSWLINGFRFKLKFIDGNAGLEREDPA
jgi:3-phenylpropionate/cinnamic acid dioxygenase small subunit